MSAPAELRRRERRHEIAFVTATRWPDLSPDDRLAAQALAAHGCHVRPTIWTDPAVRWEAFDLVVLRSCWDYHLDPAGFRRWLAQVERAGARLVNPLPTVRWNLDKVYLQELADRGVPVIPTEMPTAGTSLKDLMDARGWRSVVVKPRVSGAGHRTIRCSRAEAPHCQPALEGLLLGPGALVQPFMEEVTQDGELSFIFVGGQFTHAVRKRAAPGDFRVQSIHGGSVADLSPAAGHIADARAVLEAVPHPWSYARVDGCVVAGRLILMEVELMEPALYFSSSGVATRRFAHEIRHQAAVHEALR